MIPTRLRVRLPKHLSHPIGAEKITAALAASPNIERMEIRFSDGHWPASEFAATLANGEPYTLLAVSYHPARKPGYSGAWASIEAGAYDERWEICVYPVLRELRHVAHRLLVEVGLPAVAQWLGGSSQGVRRNRYDRIDLVFEPVQGSLSVQDLPP